MTNAVAKTTQQGTVLTPMDMLQMAVEKGADLDQLTKLMDLQERWEKTEARKAFVSSLNAFKANPPSIVKNKEVKFSGTQYEHATLDQVSGVIGQALSANDLTHRWNVEQEGDIIKVTCIITHILGHSEETAMQSSADKSGSKNPIQAIGSAVTYLQRYTLLAATGLAAGVDTDGGVPGLCISPACEEELKLLADEVGANVDAFLTYMGAATFADIPDSKFKQAKAALEKKRKP